MKFTTLFLIMIAAVGAGVSGCATAGMFPAVNLTEVGLASNNYRIIEKNASGESSAGYLLGLSVSSGMAAQTVALIRVNGSGLLYKEAMENLWDNFEQNHGKVEGRNLALTNVRYDADALNVIGLYTQVKISIRADIVEFVD